MTHNARSAFNALVILMQGCASKFAGAQISGDAFADKA